MKNLRVCLVLIALVLLISACTKKDNLTGTNWSEIDAQSFNDISAVVGGFSFPPDTLVSISSNSKCLPVGNWQGSSAKAIIRFTGLPPQSVLDEYASITDAKMNLVVLRRDQAAVRNELNLKLYKVNRSFVVPDSLTAADYSYFADAVVPATISSNDTIQVSLESAFIENWQAEADSTGLNILILAEDGVEGFVELRLSSTVEGSKLMFKYQESAEAEIKDFATYATKETYCFSHPSAEVLDNQWKLSNFSPQRMYVDIQPDSILFKDQYGHTLSPEDLKRVNINRADLVLFIDRDKPNLNNTFTYFVSAFLLKEKPETAGTIATTDMESIIFSYPLTSSANNLADSLIVNITPIVQAYTSGKKEPKGIVIMSNYERKDFGEMEFHHPETAPIGKIPYIRVKYTPPFL